jgi:hypothetical protein
MTTQADRGNAMYFFRATIVSAFYLLVVCAVVDAQASPVAYDEQSDGDLTFSRPYPATFMLDVGTNTVSGNSYWTTLNCPSFCDRDAYAFSVPAGTNVTSITRESTVNFGLIPPDARWTLRTGNGVLTEGNELEIAYAAPTYISKVIPLPPGDYHFQPTYFGSFFPGPATLDYRFDYVWTLEVTAVPEPGALLSACVGAAACLFGVAVRRES